MLGRDAVRGAQLAADLVNEARDEVPLPLAPDIGLPGLAGAELRIQVGDTRSTVDEAQKQTDVLINRYGASVVVAAAGSDVVQSGSAAAERAQVPFLDGCSAADFLTELGQGWYYRVGPSDTMLVDTAFGLLHRQRAGRNVTSTLVLAGNVSVTATADSMKMIKDIARTASFGVGGELDTSDDRSPRDTAQAIDAAPQDAVIAVATTVAEAKHIAQVADRITADIPVVGIGAGFAQLEAAAGTAPVLRTVGWSAEYAGRNPQARAVAAAYEKKFKARMTQAAAHGFTATMTAAVAINASGNGKPDRVRGALRRMWLPATQTIMPWDGVQFALNGQNELATGVIEQRVPAGYRVVFPKEIATARLIWPRFQPATGQGQLAGAEGRP